MAESEALVTYKKSNKSERYYTFTNEEKAEIDDVVSMFIKELLTVKGSNLFDRNYGTTFMDDISGHVNIYKVEYFLKNNYIDTYGKYGIESIETTSVENNTNTGYLDIKIKIIFEHFALEHYTSFLYNGIYTKNTLIELD